MAAKKIALFIDADNISAKFGKQIIATLESRGEIFIRRIYGNWEKPSLHGWNECIREFALRPVQQTDFVSGKNATDMSLTIDAMDVLHRDNAEIFALVTNDSDFTPLVIRLREGGMKIIGIGNANASNAFRSACSEFIDLNTLAEVKPAQLPPVTEKFSPAPVKPPVKKKSAVQLSLFDDFNVEQESPPVTANPKVISLDERKLQSERDKKIQLMHDALRDSAAVHANAEGFASLNHAGQDVRKKNFDFTVHDFGYGQLKDFIAAYPKLYEMRQDTNGQHFFYRCRTTDKPALVVDNDRLNRFHEVLREATAAFADDAGFADLCYVGSHIAKQNLGFGVKDLGYSSLQKFLATFPNLYELRNDDNKAFMRCRMSDVQLPDNELEQLHEVLRETAALHEDSAGFVNLWWVCDFISGKKNLVNEIKSMTYKDLVEFLNDFPDLYEIRQERGKDLCYRCCAIKPKPAENNRLQQLHKILRETAQDNRDKSGFVDLTCAGQNIHDKNFSMKGLGYGSLSKFVSAFPKLYEMRTVGKIVRYRCRQSQK